MPPSCWDIHIMAGTGEAAVPQCKAASGTCKHVPRGRALPSVWLLYPQFVLAVVRSSLRYLTHLMARLLCCTQVGSVADVVAPTQPPQAAQRAEDQNSASAPDFDFKRYLVERAQLIDAALDASIPRQYPHLINDAMRCAASLRIPVCCHKSAR